MLNRGFHFDAVQMPINPFDPAFGRLSGMSYRLDLKGMAVFSMKRVSGSGEASVHDALTPTNPSLTR